MGALTDDMTRLREEVDAWRSARMDFIKNLKSSVAAMRADVSNAVGKMATDLAGAHRAWFGSFAPKRKKGKG
jgi:hypothetical protein